MDPDKQPEPDVVADTPDGSVDVFLVEHRIPRAMSCSRNHRRKTFSPEKAQQELLPVVWTLSTTCTVVPGDCFDGIQLNDGSFQNRNLKGQTDTTI